MAKKSKKIYEFTRDQVERFVNGKRFVFPVLVRLGFFFFFVPAGQEKLWVVSVQILCPIQISNGNGIVAHGDDTSSSHKHGEKDTGLCRFDLR